MKVKKVKNEKKAGAFMDVAKISSKGQITIPVEIRKKLGLKEGDKVVFVEQNNNVILLNSNQLAFKEFQKEMEGEAEKADIKTEQDVVDMVKEVRKQIWEDRYESDA